MKSYDVIVIGAGLAGLQCARLLAHNDFSVLLVDRKHDLTKGVHTTGIFVRKTFEDFEFPAGTLGKAISNVSLYSPNLRKIDLASEQPEFRVGKMQNLYAAYLAECVAAGVEFSNGTRYLSARKNAELTVVSLEKDGATFLAAAKVLVGADGAVSRVARDLGLDQNNEWIVGYEEVFASRVGSREPRLHCFLDAKLAPGYLAWIADDGDEVHVGVGGYAKDFDPRAAIEEFKLKASDLIAECCNVEHGRIETRGGRIPVGGVLRCIANRHGVLIGDAAGAVSPLTAGGLDPCICLSAMAASVIAERIITNDANILLRLSGNAFRARFISRIWMRRLIAKLSSQPMLEFACRLMSTAFGRRFAEHVFFGRGSFPDVDESLRGKSRNKVPLPASNRT